MTPKQALLALETAIRARRPLFLWGSPGVGKSAIVAQFAERHFAAADGLVTVNLREVLRDVRAVLLDPVDVKGLPVPDMERQLVTWLVAEFFPRDGRGILFLDELNAAPRLVQAALYQLVLDRRIGDYVLPDGWHVVAAGNLETDRAITERMSTALASRFVHVTVEPDAKDFIAWGASNDIHPVILAMIQAKPELLFNFDPKLNERTFSCPRTLQFASDILKAEPPREIELPVLEGTVGRGVAGEIVAFKRYLDRIPDADKVISDPKSAEVPDYATAQGLGILCVLIGVLSRKATEKNFARILTYAERIPAEFSIFLVKLCTARSSELTETADYIQFLSKHSELMF